MDELTIDKIVNLGELRYPPLKCASILDIKPKDLATFLKDILNPDTTIGRAYQRGKDLADFNIDTTLYKLAKTGDPKSIDLLEYRQKKYDKEQKS